MVNYQPSNHIINPPRSIFSKERVVSSCFFDSLYSIQLGTESKSDMVSLADGKGGRRLARLDNPNKLAHRQGGLVVAGTQGYVDERRNERPRLKNNLPFVAYLINSPVRSDMPKI